MLRRVTVLKLFTHYVVSTLFLGYGGRSIFKSIGYLESEGLECKSAELIYALKVLWLPCQALVRPHLKYCGIHDLEEQG